MFGSLLVDEAVASLLDSVPTVVAAVGAAGPANTQRFNYSVVPQGATWPVCLHHFVSGVFPEEAIGEELPDMEELEYVIRFIAGDASLTTVYDAGVATAAFVPTQQAQIGEWLITFRLAAEWGQRDLPIEGVLHRQLGHVYAVSLTKQPGG